MANFVTLYSGSSGNSSLVTDGAASLLVDMGKSCRQTLSTLYSLGKTAADIDAILVTHEHTDHVSGLYTFLKHYKTPVYGSAGTLRYLTAHDLVPPAAQLIEANDSPFSVKNITVRAFRTSHDSADCVGYRMDFINGRSLSVATDLGYISDDVYAAICGSDLVALESNYDDDMLTYGHYPYFLKSRIRAMTGHLCNAECAAAASLLAQTGTTRLVLMHLSEENNEPELALTTCLGMLENHGITQRDMEVHVAPRHAPGSVLEV